MVSWLFFALFRRGEFYYLHICILIWEPVPAIFTWNFPRTSLRTSFGSQIFGPLLVLNIKDTQSHSSPAGWFSLPEQNTHLLQVATWEVALRVFEDSSCILSSRLQNEYSQIISTPFALLMRLVFVTIPHKMWFPEQNTADMTMNTAGPSRPGSFFILDPLSLWIWLKFVLTFYQLYFPGYILPVTHDKYVFN